MYNCRGHRSSPGLNYLSGGFGLPLKLIKRFLTSGSSVNPIFPAVFFYGPQLIMRK